MPIPPPPPPPPPPPSLFLPDQRAEKQFGGQPPRRARSGSPRSSRRRASAERAAEAERKAARAVGFKGDQVPRCARRRRAMEAPFWRRRPTTPLAAPAPSSGSPSRAARPLLHAARRRGRRRLRVRLGVLFDAATLERCAGRRRRLLRPRAYRRVRSSSRSGCRPCRGRAREAHRRAAIRLGEGRARLEGGGAAAAASERDAGARRAPSY